MQAVAVLKVIARYLGSDCELKLGRQAAWRPGSIGMVSSSWLAALCKQLLCLKVIARYLGSGYGLILGRQAAWRLGTIGMVSSGWFAALCKQSLCSDCEVWARVAGCRQTAHCRPRHCFKCADRVLCARRHTQQISCRWQGLLFLLVFGLPPLVRSDVHAGGARQCRNCAVLQKTRTTGRSYCGISGSPKGWSTRSWLTWCTFRTVDGRCPRTVSCASRCRSGAQRV